MSEDDDMAKAKKNKSNKRVGSKKSVAKRPRKSAKKAAQGRKLARYNKLVKTLGKRAAREAVFGSKMSKKPGKKAGHKGKARKTGHAGSSGVGYCSMGACHNRPIFGGAKGMRTHHRNAHGK